MQEEGDPEDDSNAEHAEKTPGFFGALKLPARPVRPATETTFGWASKVFSTTRPRASDAGREGPGSVTPLMVSEPSLKSGRKARPRKLEAITATPSRKMAGIVTSHGKRSEGFSMGA